MGHLFLDQYSLLHMAIGIISYFWNIPLLFGIIIHILFEIFENSEWGMQLINTYMIKSGYFGWPGNKKYPDKLINQIGDNISFVFGYLLSKYLDTYGKVHEWFVY